MKIGTIGYNYVHREEFKMDYPDGLQCGLLLVIKEPAVFMIRGERHEVMEKSFVIFSPDTPVSYGAYKDVYADDWMYFSYDPGDLDRLTRLGIRLDEIWTLKNPDEISQIMRMLSYEHYSMQEYHGEIESHYLEILLYKLSQNMRECQSVNFGGEDRQDSLMKIRGLIYEVPENIVSVETFASWLGLSVSGFQHAYKRTFGVNVMNDIQTSRTSYARQLLRSTRLPLREIATKCGYESEFSFMRWFKTRTGQTPTEYRDMI